MLSIGTITAKANLRSDEIGSHRSRQNRYDRSILTLYRPDSSTGEKWKAASRTCAIARSNRTPTTILTYA
jgi:hypothetical protein